jgi:hypothetical protein
MQQAEGARENRRPSARMALRERTRIGWTTVAVAAVVLANAAPNLVGYFLAPSGWTFTGAPTDAADWAQHELWAKEMAQHGRFLVNLLTPETTPTGWFLNPFEMLLGLVVAATHIPYPVVYRLSGVLVIPVLAWALATLARRAGLARPWPAVLVALLAGSLAPWGMALGHVGIHVLREEWTVYGGDATPAFAGVWVYLTLVALALVALLRDDLVSAFRRAGAIVLVLGAIYPFFLPVMWLTGALYAGASVRAFGRRSALTGLGWFVGLSLLPGIYYGIVLPRIDSEWARFARVNHIGVPSITTTVVSLGLGCAVFPGIPRLVRGNRAQQLLACVAVAVLVCLYIPQHPWRTHLLLLSPVVVLGAIAAWWPIVASWDSRRKAIVVAASLALVLPADLYWGRLYVDGVKTIAPPQYLTTGDVEAMRWLSHQPGDSVVLARTDISPWVAVRSGHRVVAAHFLWTHNWTERRQEVDAIFDKGRNPRSLLTSLRVQWILVDMDRGVPGWAAGVKPTARFGQTEILRAADVLSGTDVS